MTHRKTTIDSDRRHQLRLPLLLSATLRHRVLDRGIQIEDQDALVTQVVALPGQTHQEPHRSVILHRCSGQVSEQKLPLRIPASPHDLQQSLLSD